MFTQNEIILNYYKSSRQERGKHGDYVTPPNAVRLHFQSTFNFGPDTRAENARMAYIKKYVDFQDKRILDIGGNTAFFSFGALDLGARQVSYIEGCEELCDVTNASASVLGVTDIFKVINGFFDPRHLSNTNLSKFDIIFLLNVVHHLGDDFGERCLTLSAAKENMLDYINALSTYCSILILQMGFTWMGDSSKPLFDTGEKQEMIEYIEDGTRGNFDIYSCGVPIFHADRFVEYREYANTYLVRNRNVKEFFNRPIIILRSVVR